MPAPVTSLVGTSNQLSVNSSDPLNPIVTLTNPVTFAPTFSVTTDLLCTGASFPFFKNNLINLTYPSGQPSLLHSDNISGVGHFSWQTIDPAPVTQTVNFSFGGASSFSSALSYSQNGNIGIIKVILTNFNTASGTTAAGILCDNNTPIFYSGNLSGCPLPATWVSTDRILIGQLPIACIDASQTVLDYFLGNVYLYNNSGSAQIQITAGGAVGGANATFANALYYSFGYIQTTFRYETPSGHTINVPSCKVASFSYMIV